MFAVAESDRVVKIITPFIYVFFASRVRVVY